MPASGNRAAMVELNSETDFVSRNEQFQALAKAVAEAALGDRRRARVGAEGAKLSGGATVEESITAAVATIGEHMTLRRAALVTVEKGVVASYVHAAIAPGLGKIGVLVGLKSDGDAGEADDARPADRHARRGGEPACG